MSLRLVAVLCAESVRTGCVVRCAPLLIRSRGSRNAGCADSAHDASGVQPQSLHEIFTTWWVKGTRQEKERASGVASPSKSTHSRGLRHRLDAPRHASGMSLRFLPPCEVPRELTNLLPLFSDHTDLPRHRESRRRKIKSLVR